VSLRPGATARVRVPATSANLGPGFDTFGLALARYDTVQATVTDGGLEVDVTGEGAADVPRDETHLVVASLLTGLRTWGHEPPGLALRCANAIPHSRGLGSSAAAIVAGLVAARALAETDDAAPGPGDADVLRLAAELEGHPDNVAAALYGGFTLAWSGTGGTRVATLAPHEAVLAVTCVPAWPMSTALARGLLPAEVPYADAVHNAARAGLLVAALTGAPEYLMDATDDRLHQPYRAAAMPATERLLVALRERGVPAVLSGAGPTVLALCDRRRHAVDDVAAVAGPDWAVEAPGTDLRGALCTVEPGVGWE
jgi:homoserine kinase